MRPQAAERARMPAERSPRGGRDAAWERSERSERSGQAAVGGAPHAMRSVAERVCGEGPTWRPRGGNTAGQDAQAASWGPVELHARPRSFFGRSCQPVFHRSVALVDHRVPM